MHNVNRGISPSGDIIWAREHHAKSLGRGHSHLCFSGCLLGGGGVQRQALRWKYEKLKENRKKMSFTPGPDFVQIFTLIILISL